MLKLHDDAWIASPLKLRPERDKVPSRPHDVNNPNQCSSCKQLFTIVVRKHHCVSCHEVICGKCSKIRAHSEQGELLRQRYCILCEKEHTERNTIRNGLRIRHRASILHVNAPDLSFSEIKKLMKAPPLPGVNDHPITPISASLHRPPAGGRMRRRSTKSLMNETVSSYNTNNTSFTSNTSFTDTEPLTPDISYVETECSVITVDTSFLGTECSSRDLSSQLELELLELSDIEQCDDLQDTPIEPYAGYANTEVVDTPVYNNIDQRNVLIQKEQVRFSPHVKRTRGRGSEHHEQEGASSMRFIEVFLCITVTMVALIIVYQVMWYGSSSPMTNGSGGPHPAVDREASSLYRKFSLAIGGTLHPITSSIRNALSAPAAVYTHNTYNVYNAPSEPSVINIVLVVEKKNLFKAFSGLIKAVVNTAVRPLAEGLQDVDEIYI